FYFNFFTDIINLTYLVVTNFVKCQDNLYSYELEEMGPKHSFKYQLITRREIKYHPSALIQSQFFHHFMGYGKVPSYLRQRYQPTYQEEQEAKEEERKKKPPLKYVTEEEREEMLIGLKKNWELLQKEFQLLPMVTDTVPKIKRKTQLEKRLKELEKDIDLIERNPVIYVACDNDRDSPRDSLKCS
ncbi:hypothetical protein J6590_101661, partial [Homalodisca vitripennis]